MNASPNYNYSFFVRKIICSGFTVAAINNRPTFKAHLDDINPELFHLQLGISLA